MGDRISEEDEMALHDWICADDNNMKLFEDLTNDYKARWAKQWFKEAGVKTRFIKWKNMEGWYRPDPDPRKAFYAAVAVTVAFMILVYIVLTYI